MAASLGGSLSAKGAYIPNKGHIDSQCLPPQGQVYGDEEAPWFLVLGIGSFHRDPDLSLWPVSPEIEQAGNVESQVRQPIFAPWLRSVAGSIQVRPEDPGDINGIRRCLDEALLTECCDDVQSMVIRDRAQVFDLGDSD
jgi:hypothetical protein